MEPLSLATLNEYLPKFEEWFNWIIDTYAMLLCHERRDYTIFHLYENQNPNPTAIAAKECIECLKERGEILSIEQMKEIQCIVLGCIAARGLVIETLPSSNLRIGYYKTMDEYHLTRWVAEDEGVLMPPVVIGTDDPGIFMTNIYNEYA